MKKISLDIDDPSLLNFGWEWWLKLKEHYPDIKLSVFYVPFDPGVEMSSLRLERESAVKKLKENLDWIRLYPHGLTHMPNELKNCDYYTMRDLVLPSIEEAFKKDGLPYQKGFKAPYWLWTEGVIKALNEAGFWGAIDRNQPDMFKTEKTYTYNYSIDEDFTQEKGDLKLHGHLDGQSSNDIEKCFLNLLKMPQDAEFVFIDEFVK